MPHKIFEVFFSCKSPILTFIFEPVDFLIEVLVNVFHFIDSLSFFHAAHIFHFDASRCCLKIVNLYKWWSEPFGCPWNTPSNLRNLLYMMESFRLVSAFENSISFVCKSLTFLFEWIFKNWNCARMTKIAFSKKYFPVLCLWQHKKWAFSSITWLPST